MPAPRKLGAIAGDKPGLWERSEEANRAVGEALPWAMGGEGARRIGRMGKYMLMDSDLSNMLLWGPLADFGAMMEDPSISDLSVPPSEENVLRSHSVAMAPVVESMFIPKPGNVLTTGMDIGPIGRGGKGGKPKPKKAAALGKIAGPTSDELLQKALDTPRKKLKDTYVGAPKGLGTPEAERALVDRIKGLAKSEEGISGMPFYSDYQKEIGRHTRDPVMGRRFSSSGAHFSPNQTPFGETNHAFKAMNQYQLGHKVHAGGYPNDMSPRAEADFRADRISKDPKTGQYSYNKLPRSMRPKEFEEYSAFPGRTKRAVHDKWDIIAARYGNDEGLKGGLSKPQHVFMDRIYNKAIHELNRDPDVIKRFGPRAFDNETAQAAVWKAIRTMEGANETPAIRDIFERNKGFTQMAAIPGPSTGVDPRLLEAPLDVKRAYTDEMFDAVADPDGGNIPARALGFSAPMEEGFGPWQGMLEPNRKIDLGVGASGSGVERAIDPASAEAAQLMRDWNQLLLGQEGAGFTMPRQPGISVPDADLAYLEGVKLDSPEAYQRAFDASRTQFGDEWADRVVVQPDDSGAILKRIPQEGDFTFKEGEQGVPGSAFRNIKLQEKAKTMAKQLGAIGKSHGRDAGNDFTYKRFDIPKGQEGSYHELFNATLANPKAKELFDRHVQPLFGPTQQAHERVMGRLGMDAGGSVIDRVRTIIGGAGKDWPQAIDAAVKKGIIPAFLVPSIYSMMGSDQFAGEEGAQ